MGQGLSTSLNRYEGAQVSVTPTSRYYNFGLTFRWVRGDAFVAVKRGYVIEGRAVLVLHESKNPRVVDRPNDVVGCDQHTWIASFPINPSNWEKPDALAIAATQWAQQHKNLADWRDQPQRPPIPIEVRR